MERDERRPAAGPVHRSAVEQADDRAFPGDVRAWCKKTGHELVSLDNKPGFYEAVIEKP